MGGVAQRQRQAGPAGERCGSAAGAHDHAAVLGGGAAGADLGGPGGGGADRQHLVEHDLLAQRRGQGLDRRAGADHAPVLVEHRGLLSRREQRQSLCDLRAIDLVCADAGAAHHLESPQAGGPECHHAVAREQLATEPLLPLAPAATRLARELDQAPVVVRVAEDPRLATGLAVARNSTLVDRHGGALLGQRVRGRETDDPGPDHPDVGVSAHWASRAVCNIGAPDSNPPVRG